MGEHARWAEPPSGLSFNGLLPNEAASVIPVLDSERWSKAEERTAELIACIQPNPSSEERRSAVADYVQRLIVKCFPCQVFTFGSVPLKTYLPDGDIDLTAFSDNQNLKDKWAHQVRDMLENEEKNEHAEFRVKEVQYIQAEVKIIKCLVENIVVDISFNQLGGLCTLCFLEEVDHMINDKHLFKRSIILIKAWCYYESRILGAHHGLISTYALETLVLYIFHVFNNSFNGPLEVLYRFLEFFSKFDWDNFCLSLWGPVPISSLPVVTAEPPRKDGGVLLLDKRFLDACSYTYAGFPGGLENQGQPFVSKHFNVIDPLRVNNNLGRSVSKGNFFRIRSAFAFGAKKLARLLDCPKEDLYNEVNQFFMNTWDRHGSGHRPDAPRNDLWHLRLSNPDHQQMSENIRNNSNSSGKRNEITSSCETQVDGLQESCGPSSKHGNYPSESSSRIGHVSTVSHAQTQKIHGNLNITRTSDQGRWDSSSNQNAQNDKCRRSLKPDYLASDIKGLFARTRSSPELTDSYSGKSQIASLRLDNSRRKNLESGNLASHDVRSSTDDPSSVTHNLSHQSLDSAADANSVLNSYSDDLVLGGVSEEFSSAVGTRGMQQEEQDLVNMMASSAAHSFTGPLPFPLNISPGHLPLPLPPSVLATMGYSQRNLGGMVTSVPLIETPSGSNMQFAQGLVSSPLTHYFPGSGLSSNTEDLLEAGNENFGHVEVNPLEADHDYWHEQDQSSSAGFDLDNGSFEMLQTDDKQQSTSAGYNFALSRIGGSVSSRKAPHKFTKEARGSVREDHVDPVHYQDNRVNEVNFDDRSASSRSMPASHTSSLRSKSNSESSCEGSSAKVLKSAREKRGRKTASIAGYGKGKSVSEHSSVQADDDNRDWNPPATTGTELPDRSTGPQLVSSLHVSRHQLPGSEEAQTSGAESMIPVSPVLLGPGSQQRSMDNSGVVFYPTGPPVFITMLPVYNFQSETGTSDASTSHFSGDEGPDNSDTGQNFDLSEGHDQSEVSSTSNSMRGSDSVEPSEHKSDILNSDFLSHWQNLQYGRLCQDPRLSPPLIYPSPFVVPQTYLQGRFPWDGPGRPLSANMNLFTQLMSYGPRFVPVTPLHSASNRPAGVYQRYMDEMPRYRGGTGTYLPNPKVSSRERHSTSNRRGNYSHDRSDHQNEREGGWNVNSKSRASGRSHNRNQAEKSNSRPERLTATENRADRAWGSHRHETFPSFPTQNGPFRSNSMQSGSTNVAYGMYPLSAMNPNGVSLNGPTIPPVVMFYPYDHNAAYGSPAEQLEFGSLGPVGFSGVNEVSQLSEGSRLSGTFEEQRYHSTSGQRSPPDQPSPHVQRSVAQRNYQLKDEDFPPLSFPSQGENDGGENYNEKSYHYQDFLVSPHS